MWKTLAAAILACNFPESELPKNASVIRQAWAVGSLLYAVLCAAAPPAHAQTPAPSGAGAAPPGQAPPLPSQPSPNPQAPPGEPTEQPSTPPAAASVVPPRLVNFVDAPYPPDAM